jgi:phenylpyruvate tautomerase PptA (4-oxalocrotonate tautomerase family)
MPASDYAAACTILAALITYHATDTLKKNEQAICVYIMQCRRQEIYYQTIKR